jgi:outer membrane protein assembly factor BamB
MARELGAGLTLSVEDDGIAASRSFLNGMTRSGGQCMSARLPAKRIPRKRCRAKEQSASLTSNFWLTRILLAHVLSLVPVFATFAQTDDASTVSPSENTTQSLQLTVSRQQELRLQVAEDHLVRHEYLLAARLLEQVAADPDSSLVRRDGLLMSPRRLAREMASRIPGEMWVASQTTRLPVGPLDTVNAEHSGKAETRSRNEELSPAASLDWLWHRALRDRDRGSWNYAAAALEELSERLPEDSPRKPITGLLLVESLRNAGRAADARDVIKRQGQSWQNQSLPWRGDQRAARDIVSEQWPELLKADSSDRSGASDEPSWAIAPASRAVWTVDIALPQSLAEPLSEFAAAYRREGVLPLPAAQPLIAGDCVLLRSVNELLSIRIRDGQVAWRVAQPELTTVNEQPNLLENRPFRLNILQMLHARRTADSLKGVLSADEERVFVVESSASESSPSSLGRPLRRGDDNSAAPSPWTNRLAAYRLDDGSLDWRVGADQPESAFSLGGWYFLGSPLVLDDEIAVLAQREGDVALLFLDRRRGALLDQVTVGASLTTLAAEPLRRRQNCPLLWDGSRIYGLTGVGALICVDPLRRELDWAYRFEVEEAAEAWSGQRHGERNTPSDRWWNAWRRASLILRDDRLVFATPEAQSLISVDRDSGKVLWRIPRGNGLQILDKSGDHIVVQESHGMRGIERETGRTAWFRATSAPSGSAGVTTSWIVQPDETAGIVAVNRQTGEIAPTRGTPERLGNLLRVSDGWISVGLDKVSFHADGDSAWNNSEDSSRSAVASVESRLHRGEIPDPANLTNVDEPFRHDLARRARQFALESRPGDWRTLDETWSLKPREDRERMAFATQIIESAIAAGDLEDAAERLFVAAEDMPPEPRVVVGPWTRRVRGDRWWQGLWHDLLAQADPPRRELLEQRLRDRFEKARDDADPFALQRLHDRWTTTRPAREMLLDETNRVFLGRDWTATVFALTGLADGGPADARRDAGVRLARHLADTGYREQSEHRWDLLIARETGGRLRDGTTILAAASEQGFEPRDRNESTRMRWSLSRPEVRVEREGRFHDEVYQRRIPLICEPGSPWETIDVAVDRQARDIRLVADDQSGVWETALPASNSPFRYLYNLYRSWGCGPVLILQLGTELFAIAPYNEQGEPSARVLWTLDTADTTTFLQDHLELSWHAARVGLREEEVRILDLFEQELGQVGPVRGDYTVYRSQGKVVAIETLTGRWLWEVHDISPGSRLLGDDSTVVAWWPNQGRLVRFRACDGKPLGDSSTPVRGEDVVQTIGNDVWHVSTSTPSRLARTNLATGHESWSRDLEAGQIVTKLDAETFAVVDPRGLLEFVRAEDGATLADPLTIEVPQPLKRVVAVHDAERWYLALSERVDGELQLTASQVHHSYRVPFIRGPMLAIDRRKHQILWRRDLHDEPFPLEQSRAGPLLVSAWKLPPGRDPAIAGGEGILRCVDKRTGELLHETRDPHLQSYLTVWPRPERHAVEVRLQNRLIHFEFGKQNAEAKPGADVTPKAGE